MSPRPDSAGAPAHAEPAATPEVVVSAATEADFLAALDGEATWLHRYAYLACGDYATAEDIVASAAAKVFVKVRGGVVAYPRAYLRRAVSNELIARSRRMRGRRQAPLSEAEDEVDAEARHQDLEQRLVIWDLVQALPARQRAVVVLRYALDLTEEATAEVMATSVGTVKSQHSKAIANLRRSLGENS